MLPISEQYLLSPCELKSMENVPLLTGHLTGVSEGGIQISSTNDELPIVHCNTILKINVFSNTLGFRVLIGKVYLSTKEFIRLVEVQSELEYERRNFFRVKVDLQLNAYPVSEEDDEGFPAQPFPVRVQNLSLSGLMLSSGRELRINDRLIVTLPLYGSMVSLLCKVVRKLPEDSSCYGCEFLDNSGSQFDLLCRYLFDCQREQIRLMKQIHP